MFMASNRTARVPSPSLQCYKEFPISSSSIFHSHFRDTKYLRALVVGVVFVTIDLSIFSVRFAQTPKYDWKYRESRMKIEIQ